MEDELEIILEDEDTLELELQEDTLDVELETDTVVITDYKNKYEGEYNITPLAFQQQELETKDKYLEENVIVKEVPFFEVSNVEGTTVYIGSEV